MLLYLDDGADWFHVFLAGSASLDGLVQFDSTVAVHLDAAAVFKSYATDGPPTPQCLDENR